jgi:hypothetical protein
VKRGRLRDDDIFYALRRLLEIGSKHFLLTAVWLETSQLAWVCEQTIAGVRTALGLSTTFEFHFAEISDAQRTAFLTAVSTSSFHYLTCTLQKTPKESWLEGRAWRKRPFFFERIVTPVVDA